MIVLDHIAQLNAMKLNPELIADENPELNPPYQIQAFTPD
jgi:hypothetical protein